MSSCFEVALSLLLSALCCTFAQATTLATQLPNSQSLSKTVDLGYTTYVGSDSDADVSQWLGMSFAAPPLGDLRWRTPADPVVNHTIQSATQFRAGCLGVSQDMYGPPLSADTNEDCLYLDVYSPSNATTSSNLPVWVLVQGGGYADDSDTDFNMTEVVKRSNYSLVDVQFNYRVGYFGFLASQEIQENGNLNVGLLDQRKLVTPIDTRNRL